MRGSDRLNREIIGAYSPAVSSVNNRVTRRPRLARTLEDTRGINVPL